MGAIVAGRAENRGLKITLLKGYVWKISPPPFKVVGIQFCIIRKAQKRCSFESAFLKKKFFATWENTGINKQM
jgi:hypothetical protein